MSTISTLNKETFKILWAYPFKVFILVADQDFNIKVAEAEEFQRKLKKTNWAKNQHLREALPETAKQYRNLWKQYYRGKLRLNAKNLVEEFNTLAKELSKDEIAQIQKDLVVLSRSIAKAGGSLFSKSGKENITKLLEEFFLEPTEEKANQFLPEEDESKDEAIGTEEIYEYAKKPAVTQSIEKKKVVEQEEKKTIPAKTTPKASKIPEGQPTTPPKASSPQPATKVEKATRPVTKAKPSVDKNGKVRSAREFMPMAFVNLDNAGVWHKGKINLEIIHIKEETHDVKTFRFIANPPSFFNYKPGQFITLELMIDDKRVLRSYTISSSPIRSQFIEITIKRVEGGLVSNWMCDHAHIGMKISAKGPNGKFSCSFHPSEKLLFLSGGSGITPMMSMSRWLAQTGSTCDIIFFHNAHTKKDIIFRDEIAHLEKALPDFKPFISLTRNPPELPWNGLTGRIDLNMIEEIAPDFRERRIFVCGPAGFMNKVKEILTVCGFDVQNQYHQESFGAAKKPKKPQPTLDLAPAVEISVPMVEAPAKPKVDTGQKDQVFTFTSVHFAESQMEVFGGDMDVPLLDLAEEVGIDIPNSCRSGSCGSCKVIKMFGKVSEDSNEGLSEGEIDEGYILTCVSYPSGYVELDI